MGVLDLFHFPWTTSPSGFMWYEFCFGTTMGLGDIEVQVEARTLKHIITDIIDNTLTKKHAIEIENSTCSSFKFVRFSSSLF